MSTGAPAQQIRVADWIMDALAAHGVRVSFMVAGGGAMHLNDAVGKQGQIEVVSTLHEQAAAIAAEAYAKVQGEIALCLVTTGPGSTNAMTGVTGAWLDSTPMLVISGQVKRPDLVGDSGVRQRGVQEVDTSSLARAITKEVVMVTDPSRIRYHVERALFLASFGRPGPVWLDVPLDVQAAMVDPSELVGFDPTEITESAPANDDPVAAAHLLMETLLDAERPLILVGAGVRLSGAEHNMLQLIELLGVPVLTTWPAHGMVGDDHPLFAGCPGAFASRAANFAIQNADVLVCLGVRLDLATTGYDQVDFGRNARKYVVDIDPKELAKLEGAMELGILADAGAIIESSLKYLASSDRSCWEDGAGWLAQCQAWRKRYPIVTDAHRVAGPRVSTYRLAEVISDLLSPDDVLAPCCSGLGIEIFLLALRLHTGQRAICNYSLGAMGYGLPTAVGACLASDRRRTICVDGDGGLQLNIQELETIRRLELPIKLFVMANDGYASIRSSQTRWFGRLVGADASSGMTLPPLADLAHAYGLAYVKLDGTAPLAPQVQAVFDHAGPIVCEVPSPPDEAREPSQVSEALPDGGFRSRPIEDLAPLLDRDELAANMITES